MNAETNQNSDNKQEPPQKDEFLKKKEVAAILRISPRTLDTMMQQRIIPYTRLTTRSVRFSLSKVRAALSRRETQEVIPRNT